MRKQANYQDEGYYTKGTPYSTVRITAIIYLRPTLLARRSRDKLQGLLPFYPGWKVPNLCYLLTRNRHKYYCSAGL